MSKPKKHTVTKLNSFQRSDIEKKAVELNTEQLIK